jgi:transcriptional regulator with XRE-family HTH domain
MAGSPTFGKMFRVWREKKDPQLRQQQIAKKLGYDQTAISKYERGDSLPSGEFFALLYNNFEITDEEIVEWIRIIAADVAGQIATEYYKKRDS